MARLLPVSPPLGDGLTFSVWSLKRVTTQKMVEIKGFKEFLKDFFFFGIAFFQATFRGGLVGWCVSHLGKAEIWMGRNLSLLNV